ncbi:MAG: GNAT family N-acetyltransferase [Candidatus Hydrogenedentota bacterium]
MDENAIAGYEIIQAYLRHVDVLAPLFDEYRVFYGQPPNPTSSRNFLAARIRHQDSVVFAAVNDHEIFDEAYGFTMLYPSYNSRDATPIWILNDLFVHPSARGHGIAKALVDRGKRLAEDTGAKHLTLETGVDNKPSHELYESAGFRRDDRYCTFVIDL